MPWPVADRSQFKILALLIFLFSFGIGLKLASLKPLWGDEIRSQSSTVNRLSYGQIFSGRAVSSDEANVCPLFFAIQKAVGDAFSYKLAIPHVDTYIYDAKSQIIMRLAPNFFISATLALVFFFFARYYSLGAGLFALGMALSSYSIWAYWAEARPYAMWIFLTLVQSVLWLRLTAVQANREKILRWAGLGNYLLALTIFLGAVQVAIFTGLLVYFKIVDLRQWRKLFWLSGVPLIISVYYYVWAAHHKYILTSGWDLLLPGFPLLWLFTCLGAGVLLFQQRQSAAILTYTGLAAFAAAGLLGLFKIVSVQGAPNEVYSRHFLYLAPISLTAVVFLLLQLRSHFQANPWMRSNMAIIMVGLLITTALHTFVQVSLLEIYNPP